MSDHDHTNQASAVPVRLGERTYEVAIGRGLLDGLAGRAIDALGTEFGRALLVVDRGAQAHAERAGASLRNAGVDLSVIELDPSERDKSLATLGAVLEAAARGGLDRVCPVISVGGGIVGDIAGFAASAYRRGVPSIVCPTTLLSMVDASVGGKTGVNLPGPDGRLLKNMAGAFHQPSLVLADLESLETLPARQVRCGLAECVKHAMLAADHQDPDALRWLEAHREQLLALEPGAMAELVTKSVRLKASVVERDEREIDTSGGRALLNLGHTFAHAMESIGALSPTASAEDAPLQHGEAVALGLVAACAAAESVGLIETRYTTAIRSLIASLGLPTSIAGLPSTPDLRDRMLADKKVLRGHLRLVLPCGLGRARLVSDAPESAVNAGWDAIRSDG